MTYQVTRQEIIDAAHSLLGVPFLHQGRNPETGLDCIGLCVEVAKRIGYPEIHDLEAYKRTPSANDLLELLRLNLDEIDLSEVRAGDIYLSKMGGAKPRHVMIRVSDELDIEKGIQPTLIHALNNEQTHRVIKQPVSVYKTDLVRGFRMRGLI